MKDVKNEVTLYSNNARIGGTFYSFAWEPGDTLPNQAILVAEKDVEISGTLEAQLRRSIVLAINPGSYEPYVVWRREIGFGRTADDTPELIQATWNGDYYRSFDNAVDGFHKRH